jgi:hypothetical protein
MLSSSFCAFHESTAGSGKPEPMTTIQTTIQPCLGGAIKNRCSPNSPSSHEHGLGLCNRSAA